MPLAELHARLQKHLDGQAAGWGSFAYAHSGFYQGYDRIQIPGARSTEQRWGAYALEPYLRPDMAGLDIGCNNGFFAIHAAGYLGTMDALDINPYLVDIGRDTAAHLGVENISFHATSFEEFTTERRYDVVFSLANDDTIDGNTTFNFDEYLAKIGRLLKPKGLLIWESVAPDAAEPARFLPKLQVLSRDFEVIDERRIPSTYPTNVPFRFFLVLRRKA